MYMYGYVGLDCGWNQINLICNSIEKIAMGQYIATLYRIRQWTKIQKMCNLGKLECLPQRLKSTFWDFFLMELL